MGRNQISGINLLPAVLSFVSDRFSTCRVLSLIIPSVSRPGKLSVDGSTPETLMPCVTAAQLGRVPTR